MPTLPYGLDGRTCFEQQAARTSAGVVTLVRCDGEMEDRGTRNLKRLRRIVYVLDLCNVHLLSTLFVKA